MPRHRRALALSIGAFLAAPLLIHSAAAHADEEAANKPQIFTGIMTGDLNNGCYAKSVPTAHWGMAGTTQVYAVRKGKDRLIARFPWYARKLYLQCRRGTNGAITVTLVRFGPWQRGQQASKDHFAIGFYENGRALATYSTLDLAGRPDNVRPSVSHYRVIRKIVGFDGSRRFRIVLTDGRRLVFDLESGAMQAAN